MIKQLISDAIKYLKEYKMLLLDKQAGCIHASENQYYIEKISNISHLIGMLESVIE